MEAEQTPATAPQKTKEQLYEYAAHLLINENKTHAEVQDALIREGLNEEAAAFVIVHQISQQIKDAKKSRAKKDMLYGALWCVGGSVVTAVTYSAASSGGGRYIITWGAILFGGIQFLKGLFNYVTE